MLVEISAGRGYRILDYQIIFAARRAQIDGATVAAALALLPAIRHRPRSEVLIIIILLADLLLRDLLLRRGPIHLWLRRAIEAVPHVSLHRLRFLNSHLLIILATLLLLNLPILLLQANRSLDPWYLRDEVLDFLLVLEVAGAAAALWI